MRHERGRRANLDVALTHDGTEWIVRGERLEVRGATFKRLDRALADALRDSGRFSPGDRVTIFMGFDFDTIPTWLRQYSSHYFNRYVSVLI